MKKLILLLMALLAFSCTTVPVDFEKQLDEKHNLKR